MALSFFDWDDPRHPADTATLADVYRPVVPLIYEPVQTAATSVADLLRESASTEEQIDVALEGVVAARSVDDGRVREVCLQEIASTWRSVRSRRKPQTILHSLVLRDYMTLPQISAAINLDTGTVAHRLLDLAAGKLVGSTVNNAGVRVYFLPGIPE